MVDELLVGTVGRALGLHGEVLVRLLTNRSERLDPGATLRAADRMLTVVESRPHKDRHAVRFAGIDDREAAESLSGLELYAPPIDDPDELWVHDLIGATVIDQHGVGRGRVVSVLPNPASDLLELDTGALVPARFVVDLDPNERVVVEAPDGLFELG